MMKPLAANDNQVGLALPNLLFLLVMSWGIISSETSLYSPKEGSSGIWGEGPGTSQGSQDRLKSPQWEDPFGAIEAQMPEKLKAWRANKGEKVSQSSGEDWNFEFSLLPPVLKIANPGRLLKNDDLKDSRLPENPFSPMLKGPFDKTEFLIVGCRGGFSPINIESRIRTRMAVTSSIQTADGWTKADDGETVLKYLPFVFDLNLVRSADTEQKGNNPDSGETAAPSSQIRTVLPYQEFDSLEDENDTKDKKRLIVIYYDEDLVSLAPAECLLSMIHQIVGNEGQQKSPQKFPISYIGFKNSSYLTNFVRDYRQLILSVVWRDQSATRDHSPGDDDPNPSSKPQMLGHMEIDDLLGKVTYLSPSSTVSVKNLRRHLSKLKVEISQKSGGWSYLKYLYSNIIKKVLNKSEIINDRSLQIGSMKIWRMPSPDDQLAALLNLEMAGRGLFLSCKKDENDRILVVSDFGSSLYSEGLSLDIEEATNAEVDTFQYHRGLDGVRGISSLPSKESGNPVQRKVRAEGMAQYDYLARLAPAIQRKEKNLGKKEIPQKYRAIGVLGADAHDRLLVLQALQKEFPDRVFFTFGLDSRFWQMGSRGKKNNFLLFSTFGLSASPYLSEKPEAEDFEKYSPLRKELPPFRDSTQTATFLAVREIIARNGNETKSESKLGTGVLAEDPQAIVHEISRGGIQILDRASFKAKKQASGNKSREVEWASRSSDTEDPRLASLNPRSRLSRMETVLLSLMLIVITALFCLRPVVHLFAELKHSALRRSRDLERCEQKLTKRGPCSTRIHPSSNSWQCICFLLRIVAKHLGRLFSKERAIKISESNSATKIREITRGIVDPPTLVKRCVIHVVAIFLLLAMSVWHEWHELKPLSWVLGRPWSGCLFPEKYVLAR